MESNNEEPLVSKLRDLFAKYEQQAQPTPSSTADMANVASSNDSNSHRAGIPDEIKCPTCRMPMFVAMTPECGHSLCYPCMKRHIGDGSTRRLSEPIAKCKMCKKPITQLPADNSVLANIALDWLDTIARTSDPKGRKYASARREQEDALLTDLVQGSLFNGVFPPEIQAQIVEEQALRYIKESPYTPVVLFLGGCAVKYFFG